MTKELKASFLRIRNKGRLEAEVHLDKDVGTSRGAEAGDGKWRLMIIISPVLELNVLPGPWARVQFEDNTLKVVTQTTEWVIERQSKQKESGKTAENLCCE